MNLNYIEILKKAWKTTWKFKILWLFGILASCSVSRGGSGGGGGGNSFSSSRTGGGDLSNLGNNPNISPMLRQFAWQIERWFYTGQIWQTLIIAGIVLILLIIILRLIFAAVGTIGQMGLINGTWQVEEGTEKLNFGELLKAGWPSFWKVILFKILLIVLGIVLAILALVLTVITLGCGLLVILPASMVISYALWILVEFALVAMVGDQLGLMDAITKSWELFKKNWLTSGIMGLILAVINVIYDVILAIPLILVLIPAGFGIYTAVTSKSDTGLVVSLIISGVLLLIYIPVAIFLNGVKEAYMGVSWTMIYRRLTGLTREDEEKAARMESLESDLPPAEE